jgi:hypothetical protein
MLDRNMLSAGVFGRHFGLFKSVELPEAIPAATLIVPFPGVNCLLNGNGAAATITGSLQQYRLPLSVNVMRRPCSGSNGNDMRLEFTVDRAMAETLRDRLGDKFNYLLEAACIPRFNLVA